MLKKTFKKIILIMLSAIVAGTLFAACDGGANDRKYDHLVTFDYNVGTLGEKLENQYLGVMDGSVVAIKPGYSDSYKEATIQGYYIEGWYTAKTDADGNPIKGADGRVVLDRKWDFDRDTVSADIALYANFVQQASLVIKGGDEDKVFTGQPGATRKEPSSALAPKKEGWTLLGYYTDETYTEKFSWPYTYEAGVTTTVYARFMEGEWSIVSEAADFVNALYANKNIYLTSNIDFSQTKWPAGISYDGEINGNGYTLSGITIELEGSKSVQTNFGLFGTLAATANLHDFTVESIQASFTDGGFKIIGCKVALFAWKAEKGVKVTNVTVSGSLTEGNIHDETDVTYATSIAVDEGAVIDATCDFTQIVLPQTNE